MINKLKIKNEKLKIVFILGFFLFFFFISPKKVRAASLSLNPATKQVGIGESFNVSVILDTQTDQSDGADVIVLYDSAKLTVVAAALGDLYGNKVTEDTTTTGKVIFRATSSAVDSFSGSGIFGIIQFKAIADGTANVSFDFTAGSTTDSNIAYQGEDLLTTATGASYTVGEGTGEMMAVGVGGATESAVVATPTAESVPVSGIMSPTILLAGLGFLLLLIPLFI